MPARHRQNKTGLERKRFSSNDNSPAVPCKPFRQPRTPNISPNKKENLDCHTHGAGCVELCLVADEIQMVGAGRDQWQSSRWIKLSKSRHATATTSRRIWSRAGRPDSSRPAVASRAGLAGLFGQIIAGLRLDLPSASLLPSLQSPAWAARYFSCSGSRTSATSCRISPQRWAASVATRLNAHQAERRLNPVVRPSVL